MRSLLTTIHRVIQASVEMRNAMYVPETTIFLRLTIYPFLDIIAGSLESANSSILASCDHFKEVVGKKIRVL